ncbi:helix-turn-helix domain-containing protein [Oricola sp.]|uniref:helix-turn-helix domain-containing protein n=1 Tax=Oricola sp. TaxID=1979950 RepID=UPI00320BC3AE|nr:helix-turn-helix transcriptional regulator [Oricola sp.]
MGSSLAFRRLQLAKQAVAKSWRGFSAQYTPIDQTDPYSFEFTGTEHYLANHDLILDDGSMTVDGLSPAPGGDLRGKMTYVPSGRKIEGWAQPADRNNSFTAIYFDPAILSEETERMFSTGDFVPSVYFRDDNIRNTLERLEIALRSDNDNHVFVETLGLLGALEVARLQAEFAAAPDYRTSKLSARQERRVRDFIDARYADDIGLSDLAEIAGLSRFHFARQFKATFGTTPHQYLMDKRIEAARDMLNRAGLSMAEIALKSGFRSDTNFSRAFRTQTGVSPSAYRRTVMG